MSKPIDVVFHKATVRIHMVAAEDINMKVGEDVLMDVAMFNKNNEPDTWFIRKSVDQLMTAPKLEVLVAQKRIDLMGKRDGQGIPIHPTCPELRIGMHPRTWADVCNTMSHKHSAGLMTNPPTFCGCVLEETVTLPYCTVKIEEL